MVAFALVASCSGAPGADDSALPAGSPPTTVPLATTTRDVAMTVGASSPMPEATDGNPSTNGDVEAAYADSVASYWACVRAPASCDVGAQTASSGSAKTALGRTVADLASGGLHIGPEDVGYTIVESVTVHHGGFRATVVACWWDTAVLYGPPAQLGGAEVVMNNKQSTSRFESVMYFEDGRWLVGDERRLERVEGANGCATR